MIKAKAKAKKQIVPGATKLPEQSTITSYVIIGLDLSTSQTGYAIYLSESGVRSIIQIGSIKSTVSSLPVWTRAVMMCRFIMSLLSEDNVSRYLSMGYGVIISCEMFTPRNDFLSSMNRIMNSILLGSDSSLYRHNPIHNLYINASTLRSFMGLVQRGVKNKKENILKAYTFIDKECYPNLDTDACDAVLMAEVGHYAACILSGNPDKVPVQFLRMLCDTTQELKTRTLKAGVKVTSKTKGLMHNPNYWFMHETAYHMLSHRNAAVKGLEKKLEEV